MGPRRSDSTLSALYHPAGLTDIGFVHFRVQFLGFPGGSTGKESPCHMGHLGLKPELGRFPGEWNSCPLQYSGLEDSMDCIVHGVPKNWTQLSDFHFHFMLHAIEEKEA